MREILFKAKRIDNGKWVEGYYCKWLKGERIITYSEKETDCIITWMSNGGMSRYEVDPETLCQFTGLCDKNGKKIWENDILMAHLDEFYPEDVTYKTIEWGVAGWVGHETGSTDREYLDEFDTEHFEVVGNIFDNPELLHEVKQMGKLTLDDMIKALKCVASQDAEGDCYADYENFMHMDDDEHKRIVCETGENLKYWVSGKEAVGCPYHQSTYGCCFEGGELYWLKDVAELLEELKELRSYKEKMELQYLDDIGDPLEPLKLSSALESEIIKYNYRKENKPKEINMLDYTVMYALKYCLDEKLKEVE